jgi:hypothetical protein
VPTQPETILVKAAEEKIFVRLSEILAPLGFRKTLRRFWTRPRKLLGLKAP